MTNRPTRTATVSAALKAIAAADPQGHRYADADTSSVSERPAPRGVRDPRHDLARDRRAAQAREDAVAGLTAAQRAARYVAGAGLADTRMTPGLIARADQRAAAEYDADAAYLAALEDDHR